ncbi:hypothetical protein [Pseudoalteromonas luteoviolacea]|uniref:Uncharacterized protein n=1 Tax=Pseudoalteromonas luteoviolacea H33 TaxID=1365251 RepID=A0A162AJD6_9GAMM|nr:hypothetical protein [Pseudoalteromonas luteoviolacea]KZN50954.1 hypothetical protein N476_15030 [Pseudoalteromonas luteoviolacea H33]KZN75028.1 hypothetical protein N477_20670 [Pseudoalteromonas luteoviolacea H33-S]
MKKTIRSLTLIAGAMFASSAFSTELVCAVYSKNGGPMWKTGTPNCEGYDWTHGNTTRGRFYLKNVTKQILSVKWYGVAKCSGGQSCDVTVFAYGPNRAWARIMYTDGTWQDTNVANAHYETGL